MSKGERRPLDEAQRTWVMLRSMLEPWCYKIMVAGSVRRQAATVGDIEVLAVPHKVIETDLFGDPVGQIYPIDDEIQRMTEGKLIKNGPVMKQFEWGGFTIDLYFSTMDQWGVKSIVRTGPASYSKAFVTQFSNGGMLPPGFRIKDSRLLKAGGPLDTPEEKDVYRAIEIPYCPPEERQ